MLRQLAIRNVVLVERARAGVRRRLGVLTGETGAGKSILLDALGTGAWVRGRMRGWSAAGKAQAAVAAEIRTRAGHPVHELLAEQGIEADDGEPLILRRSLKADGGSRAFVGAASVPAGLLREIGALAVEIHGQHDERGLLNPRGHRALLDAFGSWIDAGTAAAWAEVTRVEGELATARGGTGGCRARPRLSVAFAGGDRCAWRREAGEETRLAEDRAAMQAGAKARREPDRLDELLGGSDGALAQLRQAARKIERGRGGPSVARRGAGGARPGDDRGERGGGQDRPRSRCAGLRSGPAGGGRGSAVRHSRAGPEASRGAGCACRHSPTECARSSRRSRPAANAIAELDRELEQARRAYAAAAAALSEPRMRPRARLDAAVAGELAPLKLDAARFRTALGEAEPGPSGTDRVEFEISTNPGAPFGPLTKIASGGEMSRFILALKVALAEAGSAATMIFDEIDRGVGGAVASAIGERLRAARRSNRRCWSSPTRRRSPRAATHHSGSRRAHGPDGTRTSVRRLDAERAPRGDRAHALRRARSPTRRAPRRLGCSKRHDRICCVAEGRERRRPEARDDRPQADCRRSRAEERADIHR